MKLAPVIPTSYIVFSIALFVTLITVYQLRKLTMAGKLTGGLVAICIFAGAGLPGILMLAAFFVMATIATGWKKNIKGKTHSERRNAAQVMANGGTAALAGYLMAVISIHGYPLIVFLAAALSSATADTLSSELGTVYGRRFYNIITFKPDEKGRDGVVSLEGTMIGVAGSVVIALIYLLFIGGSRFCPIVIAGTAGNLFDSVLGATLERKGYLQNNMVNFLNTAFAVLVAALLLLI